MDKCCTSCEHFVVYSGEPDYSEYTPGSPLRFYCQNNHWKFDSYNIDNFSLHKLLKTAKNCEDYKLSKELESYYANNKD